MSTDRQSKIENRKSKILICLVSEQRMQNIIPVFQKDADFEQVWLVRSTDANDPGSRFGKAVVDTRQALEPGLQVNSAEPAAGAYGIEETRRIVSQVIERTAGDVVVNFTGGTKCMSVGAYLAAQSAGAEAIYVDTANEKIVWFYPDGRVEENGFDLQDRLTVRVYLQANDRCVDVDRTAEHTAPEPYHQVAKELLSLWPECRDTLHALGVEVSRGGALAGGQASASTIALLQRFGMVEQDGTGWRPSRAGRGFLGGKWLDLMTYLLLRESGWYDDVQPELRLLGIENELDVMATRNGVLAILECKSGDLGGQATLNKLQAIRSGLGTFVRAFFVTSRDESQVDRAFVERANQYGFRHIITAETLLQVASIIKEKMRGAPS